MPKVHSSDHFYLNSLSFQSGILSVSIGPPSQAELMIEFEYASDFSGYLSQYDWRPILRCADIGSGLYFTTGTAYLADYTYWISPERLDKELKSYLVMTPQECIEVITFEDPAIREID
jgi:hypothetical protein